MARIPAPQLARLLGVSPEELDTALRELGYATEKVRVTEVEPQAVVALKRHLAARAPSTVRGASAATPAAVSPSAPARTEAPPPPRSGHKAARSGLAPASNLGPEQPAGHGRSAQSRTDRHRPLPGILSSPSRELRVLLDTSSLMHPRARQALLDHLNPAVAPSGIAMVVPAAVEGELERHARRHGEPAAAARAGLALVMEGRKHGRIEVFGEAGDTFPDNLFQATILRFCQKYDFCVVTQDRDLALDVLQLASRRSVKSRAIEAVRVTDDGGIEAWSSERPRALFSVCAGGAPATDDTRVAGACALAEGDVVQEDGSSRRLRLGTRVGAGGEGAVYRVGPDEVCKVYSPEALTRGKLLKLATMVERPIEHPAICWPRAIVRTASGVPIGYTMPSGGGRELQTSVFVKPVLTKRFPNWTRRELATLAISILEPICFLHANGVLLGDINPRNILVEDEMTVSFVDTDSYQIERFPCPVGMHPFLAPELFGKPLGTILRSFEDEYFAVATLVFMILVPGKPPYSHAGGEDPMENVRKRHFPYALGERRGEGVPDGPWRFIWSHLPHQLKDLFNRAFAVGERIRSDEWLEALHRYRDGLDRGWLSNELFPRGFKRLKREDVERRGGTWMRCSECGEGFGLLPGQEMVICPDCSIKEVDVECALCAQTFTTSRRRATGKHAGSIPCPACESLVTTVGCKSCGVAFQLNASERIYFRSRNLSLPRRCRTCRGASKHGVAIQPSATSGSFNILLRRLFGGP